LRERNYLENLFVSGKVVLTRAFKKDNMNVDWIELAQDRYKWHAFVKAVINFQIP
jgi:hypothetical protein